MIIIDNVREKLIEKNKYTIFFPQEQAVKKKSENLTYVKYMIMSFRTALWIYCKN